MQHDFLDKDSSRLYIQGFRRTRRRNWIHFDGSYRTLGRKGWAIIFQVFVDKQALQGSEEQ